VRIVGHVFNKYFRQTNRANNTSPRLVAGREDESYDLVKTGILSVDNSKRSFLVILAGWSQNGSEARRVICIMQPRLVMQSEIPAGEVRGDAGGTNSTKPIAAEMRRERRTQPSRAWRKSHA
jgi:hypothetical protein